MKSRLFLAVLLLPTITTIGISQDKDAIKLPKGFTRVGDIDLSGIDFSASESEKAAQAAKAEYERIAKKEAEDRMAELKRFLSDPDAQSLVGVKGVHVSIMDLGEDAKAAGLTKEQLQTDVELKLRLAGIRVNSQEECFSSEDNAYLSVTITTLSNDYLLYYSTTIAFKQSAYLVREPNRECFVTTWNNSVIGACPKSVFTTTLRDNVKDSMDRFLNSYLIANPKK